VGWLVATSAKEGAEYRSLGAVGMTSGPCGRFTAGLPCRSLGLNAGGVQDSPR
jgi:hypothetical protein